MKLPKVGIVIATYLESNQKYLDECMRSIEKLNYPKENFDVVVVSSGDYIPRVSRSFKSIHRQTQTHYPAAINHGISNLASDCEYYLLLNDDTILTNYSLIQLVISATQHGIYQPLSNCDQGFRYITEMPLGLQDRFYRYDDLKNRFAEMMDAKSPYHDKSTFIIVDWVPLYATLIPKRVWELVGPLDDKFKTGQDDVDYGRRAREKNIPCIINLSSLIWHFGGVTADQALTPEIRRENIEYFKEKWGGSAPI